MHKTIEPSILYFGTPVTLISSRNEDQSLNVAPMSSVWWLGWSCMIGLDATSKTTENLRREGECVLNLPSFNEVTAINRIARTTGRSNVPLHKRALGYSYLKDKVAFGEKSARMAVPCIAFELEILNVYVEESLLFENQDDRIDPEKWHPLIMSFRQYYSTVRVDLDSRLDHGPEARYAPWKQRGIRRRALEWALSLSTRRYREKD